MNMKIERYRYLAIDNLYWNAFENSEREDTIKMYKKTPENLFIENYESWINTPDEEVKTEFFDLYDDHYYREWFLKDNRSTLAIMTQMDSFYRKLKANEEVKVDIETERIRYIAINYEWNILFDDMTPEEVLDAHNQTPEARFVRTYEEWMSIANNQLKNEFIQTYGDDLYQVYVAENQVSALELMTQMDVFYQKVKVA